MKERFDKKGFSPTSYARAKGIDRVTLYKVLDGSYDGSKKGKTGETRKIIAHLKKDGVWIGALPWEAKDERQRTS